jgi:branched-chain amino acid aminotransferase
VILELARREGVNIQLRALSIDDLLSADECFLTNSIMEVMPVCRVERKAIGAERPGDLTQKLTVLYRNAITHELAGS